MEKKLESIAKDNKELVDEYLDFIGQEVENEKFFKDAVDWYTFKYVSPICDRTILIFGGILSILIFYFVFELIKNLFPLVIKDPIIIKAKDQSKYTPNLISLKPKNGKENFDPEIRNVDEAIAKYLIKIYVKDREEFDFSKASIEEVNIKFNRIKNNSSIQEFKNFQNFYSEENPLSPIQYFGKNINKKIEITDFKFIRKIPKNYQEKMLEYFSMTLPKEAEIRFSAYLEIQDEYGEKKRFTEKYLVKTKFNFNPIIKIKDDKKTKENKDLKKLKFTIDNYQLFRIKN